MREIGTLQNILGLELAHQSENTGQSPCAHPTGFEGPLQRLIYVPGPDHVLAAGHASRDSNFTANKIMHIKFLAVGGKCVWTGSANESDSGTGGCNVKCGSRHALQA